MQINIPIYTPPVNKDHQASNSQLPKQCEGLLLATREKIRSPFYYYFNRFRALDNHFQSLLGTFIGASAPRLTFHHIKK